MDTSLAAESLALVVARCAAAGIFCVVHAASTAKVGRLAVTGAGAGDAMTAGTVYALHRGCILDEAPPYGIAAASIAVQHMGADIEGLNAGRLESIAERERNR